MTGLDRLRRSAAHTARRPARLLPSSPSLASLSFRRLGVTLSRCPGVTLSRWRNWPRLVAPRRLPLSPSASHCSSPPAAPSPPAAAPFVAVRSHPLRCAINVSARSPRPALRYPSHPQQHSPGALSSPSALATLRAP
ncbi:hypothetical protein BURMUCF1_A0373 [Burkholderia multivorans ATCC BAA-247]|nr:hypothetical protein BURMUCF1_A0373 [Burkholderia multivorans ATCC BAA-247]